MAGSTRRLRVGWFSTGRGPGSRALLSATLRAIESGQLDAQLSFVFCNRGRGQDPNTDQFLDLAATSGAPVITLSDRAFRRRVGGSIARSGEPLPEWRTDFDRAMLDILAPYDFDVGMLAGYMLILSADATRARPFLNLHPAAPDGPIGVWQDVIWSLIASEARESGALINVVTPELDKGPIVSYCRFPIRGPAFDPLWAAINGRSIDEIRPVEGEENALFRAIRRQGSAREIPLVLRTLGALACGRIHLGPGSVLTAGGQPASPLDLTTEVDGDIAGVV